VALDVVASELVAKQTESCVSVQPSKIPPSHMSQGSA